MRLLGRISPSFVFFLLKEKSIHLKHVLLTSICLFLVGERFCNTASAEPIPMGSYNFFTQLPGGVTETDTTVKITAKAKDGTTFDQEFMFGPGTLPDAARDFVRTALAGAGWNVTNAGANGIIITGHGTSPIKEVDSGAKNANAMLRGMRASTDASSGVMRGEATVGEKYKFAFLPLNPGSTVLDSNGILTAILDGQAISTSVVAGQGPDSVAASLFAALSAASIPAELNGNEILFIMDGAGNEILSTELILTAGGLESRITIPERTIVPEPSTLTLLTIGTLGLLGYGWRRRNQLRVGPDLE